MASFIPRGFWSHLILSALVVALSPRRAWADESEPPPDIGAPAVSPDGRYIAFVSEERAHPAIWIVKRDGSDRHLLVNWADSSQTDPSWSPDGKRVVFVSTRQSTGRDIWSVDAGGGDAVRLTANAGDNFSPMYSPDGSKILFKTNRSAREDLWYMSADGGSQRISGLPKEIMDPSWSPDGSAFVYSRCASLPNGSSLQDMTCNLFIYKPATKELRQLTSGKRQDASPDWGPSGIVFASSVNGVDDLWLVDEMGMNLRRLTNSTGLDVSPRWDRASNTVVFTKTLETSDIWETTLSGQERQLKLRAPLNQPPVANAGVDQTLECASPDGTSVVLDGTGSSDPDNDLLTYTWTGAFGTASGPSPTVTLPQGVHTVTLMVTDGKGGTSSDDVTIRVADTTPPTITELSSSPNLLWPPNHLMAPVAVQASASDACSSATTCRVLAVTSNEPVNGLGDGDTAPDWEIISGEGVKLRAERAGGGNGRTYSILVQCTDASGNSATKNTLVTVPLNRK